MMRTNVALLGSLALVLAPGWLANAAECQAGKKLTAREIFYSAPKVAAVRRKAVPKKKSTAVKVTKQAVAPLAAKTIEPAKPVVSSPERPRPAPAAQQVQFIPVAEKTTEELPPLGLRYSILKRVGSSDMVEVDPDVTFRAGDRIRLRVETNDTAYLYIINRGSSGVWKLLFPSPQVADGSNLVEPGRTYDIPHGYVFTFDEQPGVEKLFLVLSRKPETDLDNLIYNLSRGKTQKAPPQPVAAKSKTLLAENMINISDGLVNRLRNVYARDLIIEKVTDKTPGKKKENAVYAVAPSGSPDARVVVDINLNHR